MDREEGKEEGKKKKGNEWEAGSRAMGLLGLQGGSPVSGSNG